jgi:hypothetical protein
LKILRNCYAYGSFAFQLSSNLSCAWAASRQLGNSNEQAEEKVHAAHKPTKKTWARQQSVGQILKVDHASGFA